MKRQKSWLLAIQRVEAFLTFQHNSRSLAQGKTSLSHNRHYSFSYVDLPWRHYSPRRYNAIRHYSSPIERCCSLKSISTVAVSSPLKSISFSISIKKAPILWIEHKDDYSTCSSSKAITATPPLPTVSLSNFRFLFLFSVVFCICICGLEIIEVGIKYEKLDNRIRNRLSDTCIWIQFLHMYRLWEAE